MATIIAFAGSNSSNSINYQLVKHTVSLVEGHDIQLINMSKMPFPMYSADYEKEHGFSNSLVELKNDINKASGLILSVNEHNSNPSAFFKNTLDWLSRIDRNFLNETKVFLMATSPGKGGAKHALKAINDMLPRFGATVTQTFSLPSFSEHFDITQRCIVNDFAAKHQEALKHFIESL